MIRRAVQLLDFARHPGKRVAKAIYRGPAITAARAWRRALNGTSFIGVTGSAGKTTTKDLIHAALASRGCSASDKSNNQLYSVARTLLATRYGTRFCVQEIGASERGGFDPILRLLAPSVGVITNVAQEHFKAFGSLDDIATEKGKLIEALPAHGLAILNADDPRVAAMAARTRARTVTFSLEGDADWRGEVVAGGWPEPLRLRVHHGGVVTELRTALHGAHQAGSVLAAMATAGALGVATATAAQGIEQFLPSRGRMSVQTTRRGVTFVRDDFKAPVHGLPAAFRFMAEARARRRIIVLGSLSDNRGSSSDAYKRAVRLALESADQVAVVHDRGWSAVARAGPAAVGRARAFDSVKDAAQWLDAFAEPGDLVLLKGSCLMDHLGRLALAFDEEVRCWRRRCGRQLFCEACALRGVAAQT